MRRLRSSKSGQFLIMASLVICMIIISAGAIAHNNLTVVQQHKVEDYDQIVLGIDEDLGRALINSLSLYTRGNITPAAASDYPRE